ncbi:cache domain-containing protein [Paracoccus marcusii]|uniref:cache domain-containing protein n=1 Tax=Paracoccus marcusii TaxID=59779 RepID=UPI002ED64339|nr:cache domain-containing protein [Paracoccus marcusii]
MPRPSRRRSAASSTPSAPASPGSRAIADDPANRDALASIVTTILRTRPDLVGMTLALEPDALGPDGAHLVAPMRMPPGGSCRISLRPDGSIGIEQLDMRPEAGTDSWYDRPLREDRSLITPPYLYPVNGAEVLMTTVSGVVRDGTRPVGVLTGDVSLDRLSARIEELRPLATVACGWSAPGLWIAHEDRALLGQPVQAADQALMAAGPMHYAEVDGQQSMVLTGSVAFPAWTKAGP